MRPSLRFFTISGLFFLLVVCSLPVNSQESFEQRFTQPWAKFEPGYSPSAVTGQTRRDMNLPNRQFVSRSITDDLLESRYRKEAPMPWLFPGDEITRKPAPPELPPGRRTTKLGETGEVEQLAELLSVPNSESEASDDEEAKPRLIEPLHDSVVSSSDSNDTLTESDLSERIVPDSTVSPLAESSLLPTFNQLEDPSPENKVEPGEFSSKRPSPTERLLSTKPEPKNYRLPKVANRKSPKSQWAAKAVVPKSPGLAARPSSPTTTIAIRREADRSADASVASSSNQLNIPIWTYLIPLVFVWVAWQYCSRTDGQQEGQHSSPKQVDRTGAQFAASETKEVTPNAKTEAVKSVISSTQTKEQSSAQSQEREDPKSLIEELVSEQTERLQALEDAKQQDDSPVKKQKADLERVPETAQTETGNKSLQRRLGNDLAREFSESNTTSVETKRDVHNEQAASDESPILREKLAGLVDDTKSNEGLTAGNESVGNESVDELTSLAQQLNLGTQTETQTKGDASDCAPTKFDDLTRLEGIDVVLQQALQNAGYYEYADLQKADPAELEFIVSNFDRNLRVNPSDWSRQAAFASRGDWSGLREYCRITRVGRAGESMPSPPQQSSSEVAEVSLLEAANSMVQKFASLSENENPKRESKSQEKQTTH